MKKRMLFLREDLIVSLTSHEIESRLQRANQSDPRFGDRESLGHVVQEDTKAEDDTVHKEIAHEGCSDDHPTPSSVRWHHHLHFDALQTTSFPKLLL